MLAIGQLATVLGADALMALVTGASLVLAVASVAGRRRAVSAMRAMPEPPAVFATASAAVLATAAQPTPAAPPSHATAPAPRRERLPDGPRRKPMSAVEIGTRFLKHMRDEGYIGLEAAMLPEDLDAEVAAFTDRLAAEPIPAHIMREALAALPGCQRRRGRIKSEPALRHLMRRSEALGRVGEKPTYYVIFADPNADRRGPRRMRPVVATAGVTAAAQERARDEFVIGYARAA